LPTPLYPTLSHSLLDSSPSHTLIPAHHPPRTLLSQHIIPHHHITPPIPTPPLHPPAPPLPPHPLPPHHFLYNLLHHPITDILAHKTHSTLDYNHIRKTYTSFLCQWSLPNHLIYNKWLPQDTLLPWNNPPILSHHLTLLTQYYKTKQHQHFRNLLQAHFSIIQDRDTRYISPPPTLPLITISTQECNPEKNILTHQPTITTQTNTTHIYDELGTHLITIPLPCLHWLWNQYNNTLLHPPPLEPTIQSFETEIMWLYQRYRPHIPKYNPLHNSQYTFPSQLNTNLHNTFNITHSYFSSPTTCSTQLNHFFSPFPRDSIFGSLGTAFQYKWQGTGYAHPHNNQDIHQALHWARLAVHQDPTHLTILTLSDPQWSTNTQNILHPFPDTHLLAQFEEDTLTYTESLIPPDLHTPKKEPNPLYIYCIHHQQSPAHTIFQLQDLSSALHLLNIPHATLHTVGPTLIFTPPNPSPTWHQLESPPLVNFTQFSPPLPTYDLLFPLKFPPHCSYYTDGSFVPPKFITTNSWHRERAGYGIYNSYKNIQIAARLPGLPNILRTELTALHHILQIIHFQYAHEPACIFTDSQTSLYLLKTHLTHPTHHNNHLDKTILSSMVHILQSRIHPLSIHKVRAHTHIPGNDIADQLAKDGNKLPHRYPRYDFEHAHPTPYYFHKHTWPSMANTPYKGLVRHLHPYLQQYDNIHKLRKLSNSFPNIAKWTTDVNIDNITSNNF
jgi:ribonuclease HI